MSRVNQVDGIGAVSVNEPSNVRCYADVPSLQVHGTELANIYNGGDMGDYLIRFAATLNPNGDGAVHWPQYTNASPRLLTFNDGLIPLNITLDTYRAPQMEYLTRLSLADPI